MSDDEYTIITTKDAVITDKVTTTTTAKVPYYGSTIVSSNPSDYMEEYIQESVEKVLKHQFSELLQVDLNKLGPNWKDIVRESMIDKKKLEALQILYGPRKKGK